MLRNRLMWALAIGGLARVGLTLFTYGTNDMASWEEFLSLALKFGPLEVYGYHDLYNHPPMMSYYLLGANALQSFVPLGFPALFRLPVALADVGSAFLLLRLVRHVWGEAQGIRAALIFLLSPAAILISGFHANTDSALVFFLLLSADCLILQKRTVLAGVCLGLSMNFKIVPVLAWPVFFFWLPDWKQRVKFFTGAGVVLLAGFGYPLALHFSDLYRNIFAYTSNAARWGITMVLAPLWDGYEGLVPWLKLVMTGSIVAMAYYAGQILTRTRSRAEALYFGLAWTFILYFVWTPGFGIQHLVWLLGPVLLWDRQRSLHLHAVAGILCFSAYNNWCDGSWGMHQCGSVKWNPWEFLLLFSMWVYLTRWLWKSIRAGEFGSLGGIPRLVRSH